MIGFLLQNRIWLILAGVIGVCPVFIKSDMTLSLLNQMGIAIVFALSYNMLLGQCGLLSFGHAVFFGLGAFFTIHVMALINADQFSLPTPLLPLVGGFSGLILGGVIGLIATRRAGATFAMITMGINELVASSALMFYAFFGSEAGISAMRERFLCFAFGSQLQVYYLIFIWVFICIVLMYAFTNTPLGRISNSVRDNPERTEFIGYNPVRVRGLVMMISGFFAGVAGGLYAINWEVVGYENVSIKESAFVLFMVFIGGSRQFFGPILGAVLVTFLGYYLSAFTEAWLFYLGFLFLMMVLFAPSGIAGVLMMHKPLLERKLLFRLFPSYGLVVLPFCLMTVSGVAIIEMVYRWSSSGYSNPIITMSGMEFDVSRILPWGISILGLLVGGILFRGCLLLAKRSWERISIELDSGGETW